MPKRRSLVGSAREAMGEAPKAPSDVLPVKRSRTPSKIQRTVQPSPAPAERPSAPEYDRTTVTSPATAYEALIGFASATLRQNIETGARLARCKSPMEALAAQTAHAAALAQNLFAVSIKLMQASVAPASWTPIRRPGAR